jgi:hypothetical protein
VGGTVAALYSLESGIEVRPTDDVDCIVSIATLGEYYAFVDRLLAHGFEPCTDEGAPICRRKCAGILVDIVPTVDTPIGPTNRWYVDGMRDAREYETEGVTVRAITPVYFIATKLEAFSSRGDGDFLESHDLEDMLTVLGGLKQLRDLIEAASSGVAAEVRSELVFLADNDDFRAALPGHFPGHPVGQEQARRVRAWLRALKT